MDIKQLATLLKQVSDTPLSEARLLLAHAQGNLEDLLQRRLKHEPLFKIIGKRGFWKSEFFTNRDVLDPRPDSEILIEAILRKYPDTEKPYRILDIGTGSGCLLFSLLDEYPKATGIGIDKSLKALQTAKKNCGNRSAKLYLRDFFKSDWTKRLGTFDIILSNPPYIPTQEIQTLEPEVRLYDPLLALDGGKDGLDAYRALSETVEKLLKPEGHLFLEIGINQDPSVIDLFQRKNYRWAETIPDLNHINRVLVFQK